MRTAKGRGRAYGVRSGIAPEATEDRSTAVARGNAMRMPRHAPWEHQSRDERAGLAKAFLKRGYAPGKNLPSGFP